MPPVRREHEFSFAAASKSLGRWMPQTSPVTYAMLTICCVMFGLSMIIFCANAGFRLAQRKSPELVDEPRRDVPAEHSICWVTRSLGRRY